MDLRSRISQAARTAAGKVAGKLGAFAQAPVIPGVGRNYSGGMQLTRDDRAQRIVESREALYGRTATTLGPVGDNISTHPLRGLTPERVTSILNQVYTVGWMLDWACLVEDVLRYDSQVKTLHQSATEALTGAPFTVEPADASDEARAIADYQQAVLDDIGDWPRAVGRLQLGNAQGYALEEALYEERTVRFPFRGSPVEVSGPTPVGFSTVHAKHTRWDLSQGARLELDTSSGFVVPPSWKFPFYESDEPYEIRNRGWMTAAVWLAMIRSGAWARWGITLSTWGVRSAYGLCDPSLWQDEKRRAEMLQALRDVGQGLPAIFTEDFKIEASPSVLDADTRGMHASLISAINLELSKLIIGSVLTTEISGTGSYNMSETHADSKEARVRGRAQNTSACLRSWLRAALKLVIYTVNPDGSLGDVNPKGLCPALGITPERALALCGRPSWRIARESTPESRLKQIVSAVNDLGMEVDADSVYRETGIARARDKSKRIPGKTVVLAGDAAATSTTDAVEGVENPKEDEAPSEKPSAMRRTPPRASNGRFRKAA